MINDTFFTFSLILPVKLHNLCQVVSRNGERGSDITGYQVDGWIMVVGLTRGYITVFTHGYKIFLHDLPFLQLFFLRPNKVNMPHGVKDHKILRFLLLAYLEHQLYAQRHN